jgi:hypothetical protein
MKKSMSVCGATIGLAALAMTPALAQAPKVGDPPEACVKVDGVDRCKVAIQSNNVETDDRGYIYVVDRSNTGVHILEVTGEARTIAGMK